ncbi:serine hydrolase domain-containing protein [Martelella soudanensis]|uniref:serine hydrolase domain-containing protein n=1 Tax=unclassified Martelella TaxID=2629616 RepID=UPI0015E04A7C|nr:MULTISPECIES: serine hydrolase domain-containing protein [unclassified Martelella]
MSAAAVLLSGSGSLELTGASDRLYAWWSFSKTAIAAACLCLVEEGALSLDDVPPGSPATVRQLLQHRGGFGDYTGLESYRNAVAEGGDAWSRDWLLREADADRVLFAPDRGWSYSNIGYLVIRAFLEQRTGMALGALLDRKLFHPLAIDGVFLAETRADFARSEGVDGEVYDPNWVYHGCLVGPAEAAVRLLAGIVAGRLFSPALVETMVAAFPLGGLLAGRPWSKTGYGLGVMAGAMRGVGRVVGHTGGGPFSACAVYHLADAAEPVTIAAFAPVPDPDACENEVAARAKALAGRRPKQKRPG